MYPKFISRSKFAIRLHYQKYPKFMFRQKQTIIYRVSPLLNSMFRPRLKTGNCTSRRFTDRSNMTSHQMMSSRRFSGRSNMTSRQMTPYRRLSHRSSTFPTRISPPRRPGSRSSQDGRRIPSRGTPSPGRSHTVSTGRTRRGDGKETDEETRGDLALPARRPRRRDALLLYRLRGERDRRRSGLRGSKRHALRRHGAERLRSRRKQASYRVVVRAHGGRIVPRLLVAGPGGEEGDGNAR